MDSVTLLHAEKIIYLEYWKSKNGKRVACLLRKVIQEIERRISTQAEYIRTVMLLSLYYGPLKNCNVTEPVSCRFVIHIQCSSLITILNSARQQNNLFRAREERYQSRIRVLEALASGTNEEAHVLQKLLEANPGLNIDMAQICGTISGDTGGADGTPLISGRSTWTICYLSSTLFSKTCMLLHYLAHLVLSKSTCIS
ncbi:uncharacterized protein LOC141708123 isoform X1 [Apium graveolens]|uniref:uncharacterized protein LOC141708123 isoform X1 n=1 Tax=Apium graveolens TaxID=4045 RepID=UPI003D79C134